MKAPRFWWRPEPGLAARMLAPAGRNFGRLVARRMARPGESIGIPVICVGNFVAGGAGKTPTALAIGALARRQGLKPAFLTRGYGGRLAGPVAVAADRHAAADVGDEALLLERVATTVVSRDRLAGARLAASLGADLVIMDDGLQNPSLWRDYTLAVVDGGSGIGNGLCLPAGPLRAPLADQLRHVDAVLVIGEGDAGDRVAWSAVAAGRAVHRAHLVPDASVAAYLAGRRVLAFAGIGRPQKFFRTLEEIGAVVVDSHAFGDHEALGAAQARLLVEQAEANDLILVTTEKDIARMAGRVELAALRALALALPVSLDWRPPAALEALLRRAR